MDNQAQIRKGSTAISTATRNSPNRLGIDTQVYPGSAELTAMCALAGRIVTVAEYMEQIKLENAKAGEVYAGGGLDGGDHDHLVAGLGDLPGAVRADMDDALAEAFEQRRLSAWCSKRARRS